MPFRFWVFQMVVSTTLWIWDAQAHALIRWLNAQPSGTQGLAISLLVSAIGSSCLALWYGIRVVFRRFVGTASRYAQWTALAAQFHDLAQRDDDVVRPTDKRKVTVSQHHGTLRFADGAHSHHAAEAETLSRLAGTLLAKSRVPHARAGWRRDPVWRWVQFVARTIPSLDRQFARDNIHTYDPNDAHDSFHYFDVFPFAAYLVCKHCASFEHLPTPNEAKD